MIRPETNVLKHILDLLLAIFEKRMEYIIYCTFSHIHTKLNRLSDVGRQEQGSYRGRHLGEQQEVNFSL